MATVANELTGITTISRKRLGDQIAVILRRQILLGELVPAKSPVVANPSVEDLTQLILVQSAQEGECACEKITADELDHIKSIHKSLMAMADEAEPLDFFTTDMAFHEAIVAATKNQPLIKTHRQYNSRLWRARFMSSRRRTKKRSHTLREHASIIEGLSRRDKAQTSAVLVQHLRDAITNIASVMSVPENQD